MRSDNTPPFDRYGFDVLGQVKSPASDKVFLEVGMLIEDVQSGFVGEVMRIERVAGNWQFELEDATGFRKAFPFGRGYWIEGKPVELVRSPQPQVSMEPTVAGKKITASGSLHDFHRARTARESRIWVEGKHDAELIAKIWGEDLAIEGVVVEELLGVDNLPDVLAEFQPNENRRAGILVDHLVAGSKESRIAQSVAAPGVLVLGHPYVDVWQAIKPAAVGITKWPEVPRGEDIKVGTLKRLGWPCESGADIGIAWARILARVNSYKDVEASLLGRMEELIDFVTEV